jgi:hypothetical protein
MTMSYEVSCHFLVSMLGAKDDNEPLDLLLFLGFFLQM